MTDKPNPDGPNRDRRQFLETAAMTVAAAEFGAIGLLPSSRGIANAALFQKSGLSGLGRATEWINSPPLTEAGLMGKPVLVNFCTYTCINWLRTLPYVRAWAEQYKANGLVTIGVHTPEFAFEKNLDNVRRSLKAMNVGYPVAVDNDYGIWTAFDNHYWPALYLLDGDGRVRYMHFGEGEYQKSEKMIQTVLGESGAGALSDAKFSVDPRSLEAAADWDNLRSGENYLGYDRTQGFASPGGALAAKRHVYAVPARFRQNDWALAGDWTVRKDAAALNEPGGHISYRFHARDVHLVMGPAADATPVRFRVLLDGQPPGAAQGSDIDERGAGILSEQRLHQLIRQSGPIADRQFEIEFSDRGAEAFCFTFG